MDDNTFKLWKGTVRFLIESANADPDAMNFDYGHFYRAGWGAMETARQYLNTLQQTLKNCGNN